MSVTLVFSFFVRIQISNAVKNTKKNDTKKYVLQSKGDDSRSPTHLLTPSGLNLNNTHRNTFPTIVTAVIQTVPEMQR